MHPDIDSLSQTVLYTISNAPQETAILTIDLQYA